MKTILFFSSLVLAFSLSFQCVCAENPPASTNSLSEPPLAAPALSVGTNQLIPTMSPVASALTGPVSPVGLNTFTWSPHSGADIAAYIGLTLTFFGFIATYIQIYLARSVVEKEISRLQTIHGLSSIQSLIEELKRLIILPAESAERGLLPYKTGNLRKIVIEVENNLNEPNKKLVTPLIIQLKLLEDAAVSQETSQFNPATFFPELNQNLDTISRLLAKTMKERS